VGQPILAAAGFQPARPCVEFFAGRSMITVNMPRLGVTGYDPARAYNSYVLFGSPDGKTHLIDMNANTLLIAGLPHAVEGFAAPASWTR